MALAVMLTAAYCCMWLASMMSNDDIHDIQCSYIHDAPFRPEQAQYVHTLWPNTP